MGGERDDECSSKVVLEEVWAIPSCDSFSESFLSEFVLELKSVELIFSELMAIGLDGSIPLSLLSVFSLESNFTILLEELEESGLECCRWEEREEGRGDEGMAWTLTTEGTCSSSYGMVEYPLQEEDMVRVLTLGPNFSWGLFLGTYTE